MNSNEVVDGMTRSGPMAFPSKNAPFNVALVSAPWPLYNRPSIQLGALKAYLRREVHPLRVQNFHVYLDVARAIGYDIYDAICRRTWTAEAVYAALMFPEMHRGSKSLFHKQSAGTPALKTLDFDRLTRQVKTVSDASIQKILGARFDLIGCTVCMSQLNASLYFLSRLKKAAPHIVTVAGGSLLPAATASEILDRFPFIDFAVCGEGERPFAHLISELANGKPREEAAQYGGIVSKKSKLAALDDCDQIASLDGLPEPDFDDYFLQIEKFPSHKKFFPTLPVEMSRGCWWRSRPATNGERGCAFCNLNLQWKGYRFKSPVRMVSEIDRLTARHKSLSVAFMDNLLPPRAVAKACDGFESLQKDLHMFAEIRATSAKSTLADMKKAGFEEVQIGIEALSSHLLKRLDKGTKAIENLEIMKHCEEMGIRHKSNLIMQFPGSDQRDVDETLRAISFSYPFQPLRCIDFWLGLGSPVWRKSRDFGLTAVFNHPNYKLLFPKRVRRSVPLMIQGYRGDLSKQRDLWKPVKKSAADWQKTYAMLHGGLSKEPILSYRDGGDFLILRRRSLSGKSETHRLTGTSRSIYLFCDTNRSFEDIRTTFSHLPADRILGFLQMMMDKKLMFEESRRYLSLAVRAKSRCAV